MTTNRMVIVMLLGILLSVIPLLKAGKTDYSVYIMSLLLIPALVTRFWSQTATQSSALAQMDRAWLRVWLIFSFVIFAQLFIIPRLVSWNSPEHGIEHLYLQNRPVNLKAILESWVLFCCYLSVAFLASKINRLLIRILLTVITASLLFQLIYGVTVFQAGQETILGIWPKQYYTTSVTGTFVNHNHYANYIAITLPLALAFCFYELKKRIDDGVVLFGLASLLVAPLILLSAYALVLSTSRMGVAIGGFGIILFFSYIVLTEWKTNIYWKIGLALVALYFGLLVIDYFGAEDLIARFQRLYVFELRWTIWPAMIELPTSMWLLGAGAGCFFDVFLMVHPPTLPRTIYHAHNDYLQFVLEYGILGATAMIYAFAKLISAHSTALRQPHPLRRAAWLVIILTALHCLVDFNLHIPANALIFWFAFGLLLNTHLQTPTRSRTKKKVKVKVRKKVRRRRKTAAL